MTRLLTGGRRTALPRQQTLQALIDWSWNLLNEQECMLLRRLSVFFGGWTLEAAQSVASDEQLDEFDILDLLNQLINKSLVNVKHLPQGEVRFNMLASIHQYARNHLIEAGEWERLCNQHAEYYTRFGEQASHELQGQEMLVWLGRLLRETDNAKATRVWTLNKRFDLALRIAGASMLITRYWFYSSDDIHWLVQVVERAQTHPQAETNLEIRQGLSKAVIALGAITTLAGDFDNGRQVIEQGIGLAKEVGVVEQRILGLNILLITLFQMGELNNALNVAEKSLTLSQEHSLNFWRLMAIGYLVTIFVLQGKNEQADYYAQEAIQLAKKLNNPWLNAMTSFQLTRLEERRENWDQAEKYATEAADLFEDLRDYGMALTSRSALGHLKRKRGDLDGAEQVYRQTVIAFQERGHSPTVAHQLECFGMITVRKNQDVRAAKLFGAANTIRQTVQVNRPPSEQIEYDRILAQLAETMGAIERDRVMAEGAKMSLDEAVELALALA
jgi:tetratricopeptide (TPR) repeat protein